jgi:hypothetical protein
MKHLLKRFLIKHGRVCERTGAFHLKAKFTGWSVLLFPLIGAASLLWFLIRVVPKPARATYPCMKVAAPVASSFIVWLIGLAASAFAFKKTRETLKRSRYWMAAGFAVIGLLALLWTSLVPRDEAVAVLPGSKLEGPNLPMGEAKGLYPGRVVWAHDPAATTEACTNKWNDAWFLPKNNDQAVIDRMFSAVLRGVTGLSGDKESWDAIFKFYNSNHGKGSAGYKAGEKIFIKTNATSAADNNTNLSDLSMLNNGNYAMCETNPHVVLAVLRHLINVVGVAQGDIYVGEPMHHAYKHCYDLWHAEFPNINVVDRTVGPEKGRWKVAVSANPLIFYSDRGTVLKTGSWNDNTVVTGSPVTEDKLYNVYEMCDYLINIANLKAHARAGVTMFAKNHFGSHIRDSALHLHGGLVNPTTKQVNRQEYGLYRVLVDMMGHKLLGGKNLIMLLDALYTAEHENHIPVKMKMPPFNGDWMSSLFMSLDPVAIESVGFDFLRAEFTSARGWTLNFPQWGAVDDYLHQAADKANWPAGITYDPEKDGTPISSLGVHEHWNNETDMKYTRNLGTGSGIELMKVQSATAVGTGGAAPEKPEGFKLLANYPNPFNPSTSIKYDMAESGFVTLSVYDAAGRLIKTLVSEKQQAGPHTAIWNGLSSRGLPAPSGVYVCLLRENAGGAVRTSSIRMLMVK